MAASNAACPTATLDDAAMTQRICCSARSHISTRKGRRVGILCKFGFASSRSNSSTRKYAFGRGAPEVVALGAQSFEQAKRVELALVVGFIRHTNVK